MDSELLLGLGIFILWAFIWGYVYTHQKPHWKQVARNRRK